jgi:hypothetical protein
LALQPRPPPHFPSTKWPVEIAVATGPLVCPGGRVARVRYAAAYRTLQDEQGRTGAQTRAPRPRPRPKLCAPRPAPPSAPALMGDQGHPAAGPRPIRPSSLGSQSALTSPTQLPTKTTRYCSTRPQPCEPQVPQRPGRDPARSPSCYLAAKALLRLVAPCCDKAGVGKVARGR